MTAKVLIMFTIGLGMLATILTHVFASKGYIILIPYLIILTLVALQMKDDEFRTWSSRFKMNFCAFFLMSISLYISIILDERALQLSVSDHVLRVFAVVAIGTVVSIVYSSCFKPVIRRDPCP